MEYSLCHAKWRLKGVAPNVPMQGNIMETGRPFRGLTPWLDCRVPGGVALALYRAGWLEYPYYGMNSLKCEWVEHRWWMYETTIERPNLSGSKFLLRFLGVDYDALIYLNNRLLGEHVGMFEPFSYDITEEFLKSDRLKIQVMIKSAPDEVAQVGRTSDTTTQKSRFGYKWDFGTRLVNLGIWEDVQIVSRNDHALEDISVSTDLDGVEQGIVRIAGRVRSWAAENIPQRVEAVLTREGAEKARGSISVENGAFAGELRIEHPELWYPNGRGAQPLYDLVLSLYAADACEDVWRCKQGIRRLRYLANDNAPRGALPYTYEVNYEKVYIKGVNLTPLDHIYGDIPPERYETTLRAIAEMNVNFIRVWGGGLIEKEYFYDLCDRYGFLVWQEFIQSSSGIDNVPSKHPEFLALLEKTARSAVKVKRNHTCLAAWSGGNELMDEHGVPAGYDDPNIAMLKSITDTLDPCRMMYPTSASGPNERQSDIPDTSHDVHGDWEYGGNPGHYHAQATADHLFNSEFGCSGVSSSKTACRVLPKEEWRPANMRDNAMWRFRGDWWCTYERDLELFGEIDRFPEFSSASQWIQAEAVRYTVEANRRRAFRNSGSVIWQFNEPWPNIANTCLYTYFDEPKMAYYWAKHAYAPYHVSLDYRRLDYRAGEMFAADVWLSHDAFLQVQEADVTAQVLGMDGRILYSCRQHCVLDSAHSTRCMALSFPAPEQEVFAVRVAAQSGAYQDETCYFFSTRTEQIYRPYLQLPEPELEVRLVSQEGEKACYTIANRGKTAALHIHAVELTDRCIMLPEEDFVTLFPGETRTVTLHFRPRFNYGFDEYPDVPQEGAPEVTFRAFPLREMFFAQ